MENKKIRLNSATSQNSVNEDSFTKMNLQSKTNSLPLGEINKLINLNEQFNTERQNSKLYRLTANISSLFTNVLFNTTGDNSWSTFNKNEFKIVDNGTINDPSDDLSYDESIITHLKEKNGWFGYYNNTTSKCVWQDMEPNRNLFSMTPKNLTKNWEITVTYPTYFNGLPGNLNHPTVKNGLLIIKATTTRIGGRDMLTLTTFHKHGLSQGSTVRLKGLTNINNNGNIVNNGDYTVIRIGNDDGDDLEYNFTVDISNMVSLNSSSRMVKIINNVETEYYLRVFKKIKTTANPLIQDDDYEIYPLAFSQTIYGDKKYQLVFNEDIDISDLVDNRRRPLTEIYITIIKTDSNNVFTPVKSGFKTIYNDFDDVNLSDIHRITNDVNKSQNPIETDLTIERDLFYGDVVEYNKFECKETVLGDIYHRFNTFNRESNGSVNETPLGSRYEGYMYKPHHKIQIKNFSTYIEQGNLNTLNLPVYSDSLGDGRYLWRDVLDIGVSDAIESNLDYPFLNGCHYINKEIILPLKRQDPFGKYNLLYSENLNDPTGRENINDNITIKKIQDVC